MGLGLATISLGNALSGLYDRLQRPVCSIVRNRPPFWEVYRMPSYFVTYGSNRRLRGLVSAGDQTGSSDLVGGLLCGTIAHLICLVPDCRSGCSRLLEVACPAGSGPVTIAREGGVQGRLDNRFALI
jgi:hypothetical protein